jgi:cell division protein FtsQ
MKNRNTKVSNQTAQASTNKASVMNYLSKLFFTLFIALIAYVFYFTIETLDRPLTKVSIEGEFKYLNQQDLAMMVNEAISGGFLRVDLSELKQVVEQHPWVSRVMVERQWPSQLKIDITEEVPIARWGDKAFLNRLGESLNITDNSHLHKLPLLTADFGESTEIMEQYQYLSRLLLPTGLKLSELQLDAMGVWKVKTNRGIRLVIGRDEVGEKIRRLVAVWESGLEIQSDNIAVIDMRYPNGLAITWRNADRLGTANNATTTNGNSIHGEQDTTEV